MKKILIGILALCYALSIKAQQSAEVRPLTPAEVSERLIPSLKLLAFGPITPVTYEYIQSVRLREKSTPIPALDNADSVSFKDLNIPGLNSGDPEIPIRIYTPKYVAKAPIMIWFHGGGFIIGNLNMDHKVCANMAIRGGVILVSVQYRLSPENKYPAAVNDGYATLLWSKAHAVELGADPEHIGVGGGSAGAGVAGSLSLMDRDIKGPKISFQALVFPPADIDTSRVSVREFRNIPGVKGADLPIYMQNYLTENDQKNLPVNVLPGLASDFHNLPPTYIVTCGVDPLRDGGIELGKKMIESGNQVELHNYPGYPHGALPDRMYVELYTLMKQYLK